MWKVLFVAIVLVVAACSPSSDDTTTTTAPVTTTAPAPTTTAPATTTTTTMPPSTTTTVTTPEDNEPPSVEIISPVNLSSHKASWSDAQQDNGANVTLSAIVSDPDGDDYTVTWSSNLQGNLGTGESIVAFISTGGQDTSEPFITATATDEWGASTSVSVQIIVWIPSDA